MKSMSYKDTGVNYDAMDPFKRMAQGFASDTAQNARRLGVEPIERTRGESVYAVRFGDRYIGHVEEGLGTKNKVADAVRQFTGQSHYDQCAQCTIAMIVNDMTTLVIFPVGTAMHLAVGESEWFSDELRAFELLQGWRNACYLARTIWSGGETPTLKDIVVPGESLLSGSAWGVTKGNHLVDSRNIAHGDSIVLLTSSGIHANGLTLARRIAEKVPQGYEALLSDGRTYGESLLDPTHIYVGFVEDCIDAGVDIHYAVNITGHGWRKLMRAVGNFTYTIEVTPTPQPVFEFMQKHGPVTDQDAYGDLNMGAGFAIYVSEEDVSKMQEVMEKGNYPFEMLAAGHITKSSEKKVEILPKRLTYAASTLAVR